jgi:ThiF family
MTQDVEIRFAQAQFDTLYQHLYPGDGHEHAAVVLATLVQRPDLAPRLLVREVLLARDGVDYVVSPEGHGRLLPTFINKAIVRCRNEQLVYFHVHNHLSDQSVGFSDVDYASHLRGYPALLDIAKGMPVGGMVFGYRSLEIDLWWPDKQRSRLKRCLVVGSRIRRLYSHPRKAPKAAYSPCVDRQVLFLGEAGQAQLAEARLAIVGLGGVGSMVVQDLARLGVGQLLLIDSDVLDETNLSRVVTATSEDVRSNPTKTELSVRYAKAVNPKVACETVRDDVAYEDVADKLADCDYIFLCADTMRARLVVNAVVNQHFVPAVQVGSKILVGEKTKNLSVNNING